MNKLGKFFVALGLAYVGAVAFTNCSWADEAHDKQVFAPAVQIEDYCSGTIIHSKRGQVTGKVSTIVLTAKHCVDDKTAGDTLAINQNVYNTVNRKIERVSHYGELLGSSYKADLALIKLKDEARLFDAAEVAPKDIKLTFGQAVEVIGYPLGGSMTWTMGNLGFVEEVGAFSQYSQSKEFYRATPDVLGGSSGSPMFTKDTDGKFKVIGTLTGGVRMGTFFNFFTPIEEIQDYLETASKTFDDPKDVEKEEADKKAKEKETK